MQEHHRERQKARLTLPSGREGGRVLNPRSVGSVRPRICSSAAAVSLSRRCRSKRSSVGEASPFVPPRGSWCIPAAASVKGRFSHARPRRIVLCNCQSAVRRCCEKLVLRCGWCGELTVRRSAGVAVPRKLRSGETSELGNHAGRISRAASASAIGGSGVWLASVPLLERPPCKASNCGRLSCDLPTSKRPVATGRSIRGPKLSDEAAKPNVFGRSPLELGGIPLMNTAERAVSARADR